MITDEMLVALLVKELEDLKVVANDVRKEATTILYTARDDVDSLIAGKDLLDICTTTQTDFAVLTNRLQIKCAKIQALLTDYDSKGGPVMAHLDPNVAHQSNEQYEYTCRMIRVKDNEGAGMSKAYSLAWTLDLEMHKYNWKRLYADVTTAGVFVVYRREKNT